MPTRQDLIDFESKTGKKGVVMGGKIVAAPDQPKAQKPAVAPKAAEKKTTTNSDTPTTTTENKKPETETKP